MSDLRKNLTANFRRYTDGKNKVEYIAKIAMYSALSFVLYAFCKFPLPVIFPSFLDIQISEIPALIAGYSMGPISGCLVIVLKCLFKFPLTSTMFVGEATDIILGISFVLPASIIYNCKKSKKSAIISLVVGSLCETIMGVLTNYVISIPFYVEVMFNGSYEPLLNMLKPLYKDITRETFYAWYLGVGILPFNILRSFIVSLVTFILYPRLKRPLRLEATNEYNKRKKYVEDDVIIIRAEEPESSEIQGEIKENSEEIENIDSSVANSQEK